MWTKSESSLHSFKHQPDDKIVVVGGETTNTDQDFLVVRFNGESFDRCVQDDNNGSLLVFNSVTGEYRFSHCKKNVVIEGRGTVSSSSCKIRIVDDRRNRRLSALVNVCTRTGSMTLNAVSLGKTFTISDSNITDNYCACR